MSLSIANRLNPSLKMLLLALGLCGLAVRAAVAAEGGDQTADERLREIYSAEYEWRKAEDAMVRNAVGGWRRGDHFPDVSAAAQQRRLAYWQRAMAAVDAIPADQLSREEAINAAVFRQIVQTLIDDVEYQTYEAPLNSDTMFWTDLYPLGKGFGDTREYRDYIARLRDLPRYFKQHMDNMRAGLERGYSVPRVALEGRDLPIEEYLVEGESNPFWEPLTRMPPAVPEGDRAELREMAAKAIEEAAIPAYRELLDFLRKEYLPNTRTSLAALELPDGKAFYQSRIKVFSTLDMTPEAIHQRGLEEVERIAAEMQTIMDEVGFEGDLKAFLQFLRTDPQFYAKTPRELLSYSAYVAKKVDGVLGETLGFLPRARFALLPVPDAIAPFYTSGRGGDNACWMNTYDLPSRPLYNLPALTLHECSPGHALQGAIAEEFASDIPEFRRDNYFSGYGEGWGLYTEWLGTVMGIYETPYENFGRLSYEMWRACRLVIDTGIHYYGWTREQAQQYLSDRSALSTHEITTEVDRYISWPGQALAYKLGELVIRKERARAEEALGAGFDQRYFHDKILKLRSVPLPVLEAELEAWIESGGPDPYADVEGR